MAQSVLGVQPHASAERLKQWGETLRMMRVTRGFRRASDLAAVLGVTQQTVSHWECGRSAPRDEMKAKIAGVLNVDAAVLWPIQRQS